jgi:hypothetical protein
MVDSAAINTTHAIIAMPYIGGGTAAGILDFEKLQTSTMAAGDIGSCSISGVEKST